MTKWKLGIFALVLAVAAAVPTVQPAGAAGPGGPVIIMGIDAEDDGVGGHGPIETYDGIVTSLFAQVGNGGTGILVFGGGKDATDDVTTFWNQIAADTGKPVTFVNGATDIASRSFAGFGLLAVASSSDETSSGGLTDEESEALKDRSFDVATFVNGGGGLLVFTQNGQTTPYGFLGDLGTFVSADIDQGLDDDITPTAAGTAAGVTDALDVCCWHHQFTTFPNYLVPLATYTESTEIAAIGGGSVKIPTGIVLDPATQTHDAGGTCAVTATVTENQVPVADRKVTFSVTGPNGPKSGEAVSNASGVASFSYTAPNAGTDTIGASFVDSNDRTRTADTVTCTLVTPTTTSSSTTTTSTIVPAARPIAARPAFAG